MKYVVIGYFEIYLFGRNIDHGEFAKKLGGRVTSAGFVKLQTMECHGGSVSLGLSSANTDTALLRALVPSDEVVAIRDRAETPDRIASELKSVRAEIGAAMHDVPFPQQLQLQAADRRLAGLIASAD